MTNTRPEHVLKFWFADALASPELHAARHGFWFKANPEADAQIRSQFSDLPDRLASGLADSWAQTPKGRLAAVIGLDQFPRNLYRGKPEAFSHDALARRLCEDGITHGDDGRLHPLERAFFYLPLEHAEDLAAQDQCVALMAALPAAMGEPWQSALEGYASYALAHRDVIARFGRFPHRNTALGRASTVEEIEYLQAGGGF
jgi:uncharacterized protein (DUF924 family)